MELPSSPHRENLEKLFLRLESNRRGLARSEAEKRKETFGENILPTKASVSIYRIFFVQFLNPLIYVLAIAAVIAAFMGDFTDAFFIVVVLLINAVIGTIQEYSAEQSALALQQLSATKALVLREDELFEIDAKELVPGDIISIESGNKVPADIRLINSQGLEINESLLTGESLAVRKDHSLKLEHELPLGDQKNMAFTGSIVMKGRGKGLVTSTGLSTALGKIAEAMSTGISAKPPLIIRMEEFTRKLTIYLVGVTMLMGAYLILKGQTWHEVMMFSVALAVSAIPEGLPVALTIALSIASRKMSKRNVIVRKLPAVEALGSCTYIATDKTGTLTVNQLTIKEIAVPHHSILNVTGSGLTPDGKIQFENDQRKEEVIDLIKAGVLCNEAQLFRKDEIWQGKGDAVDVAFLVLAHKEGFHPDDLKDEFTLIDEVPYEAENKFAATLHKNDKSALISAKGALEKILTMCEDAESDVITALSDQMAEAGLRVLAVAKKEVNESGALCEQLHDLKFLGFVGMIDPLRSHAKDAVLSCQKAGIKVAMVTGDHPKTAMAIARELGLASNPDEVVSGPLLKNSSEEEKKSLIEKAKVFARVEPQQKLDIVKHLIDQGEFVAVTGDGANDAPALQKANVGIAMGQSGTDVAKETSDLIITDDKFSSIVSGIEEGRIAYSNVRKVITLLVTTGVAEILMFILSLIFQTPLPLTPIQLLWLNLVTNSIQHIGLTFEPGEGDELFHPPRQTDEPIFNNIMIQRLLLSAVVIGGVSFWQFQNFLSLGYSIFEARNFTLLLMVLFENMMVGNCRSETKSAFSMNPLRNPILVFGTIGAQLFHIACLYIPSISMVVGLSPVSLQEWIRLLGLSLSVLVMMEIYKLFLRWRLSKSSSEAL